MIDEHWATVGSSNLDPFSLLIALEANIGVDDQNFTMLLGGKLSVSRIDRTVKLDISSETRNGRIFRLKRLGMADINHHDQFGAEGEVARLSRDG
ncbi:MAG: hypothetical protein A2X81_06165 [Desulfobacterales bacterium GWB2_56_26]|nr:MAG: hypothetical protein A2X81_06165 [Desulfobacterales bacterium GWB2_56_26]